MKIYIISHYYDNGESYEDYREYEDHKFYSTYRKGMSEYCDSIISDYQGRFILIELELDTQERTLLEESPWHKCTPYYDEQWQGDYEPEYEPDPEDYYPDPMKSYKAYWRYEDDFWYEDDCISEEEDKAWLEYVTTPGTNYKEWKEINEEIQKRKNDILLEELNSSLVELLK